MEILTMARLSLVLTGCFVVLNILDGHSTYQVLKPYHYQRERNPIARWIFRKLSIPNGIIIFKAVLLAILIPAMAYYAAHDPFTINIVLLVSNILFLIVVMHNYKVYRKVRKWEEKWQ
jgi:hypothetical protein